MTGEIWVLGATGRVGRETVAACGRRGRRWWWRAATGNG